MDKKTALIIIDMQNDFVLPNAPMCVAGAMAIIPNLKQILPYRIKLGFSDRNFINVKIWSFLDENLECFMYQWLKLRCQSVNFNFTKNTKNLVILN